MTPGLGSAVHAHTLRHLMPFDTSSSQLQELSSYADYSLYSYHDPRLKVPFVGIDASVLKRVESCRLKRLDMRGLHSLGPEGMSVLIASLATPACPIQDLGINLTSTLPHWHHTRLAILAQAFQSGSSLSKLKVLRVASVDSEEAAACVADILGSPQANCKVRFLEVQLVLPRFTNPRHIVLPRFTNPRHEPFFKKLHQIAQPRIECLRVSFNIPGRGSHDVVPEMLSLCDFLGQEQCPLLWLQCLPVSIDDYSMPEDLQMKLANSLEANFRLNFLHIYAMDSPAATSRASAFLARNHLYKAMGLSKDDYMKPQVARLFLCGDGEVGKTTLRKALVSQLHNHSRRPAHSSPSASTPSPYGCTSNVSVCFQACQGSSQDQLDVEPRTRGLEIHQLSFGPDQNLAVFDLGGQPDYHHFHHYLMASTSHDLFIVVCRYSSELASQAEYWLRFIVSHRSSVEGRKPRILLVVNFTKGQYALSPMEMKQIAVSETQHLRLKYTELLDFGAPAHQRVFGIVAVDTSQARPVLEMLEVVLVELLEHRPLIPKLCDELLSTTLPLLAKEKKQSRWGFQRQLHGEAREGRKLAFKRVIVDFGEVKGHYVQQQDQAHRTEAEVRKIEKRLQASVTELHNAGEVVFFPPVAVPPKQVESRSSEVFNGTKLEGSIGPAILENIEDTTETSPLEKGGAASPIIVDPNWFYNKVIGNLLAPESLLGQSKWTESQIKQVLIESGCPVQYMNEVLRYILSLDLCFCFCEKRGTASETKYFFPAVASEKELHWPPNFIGTGYKSSSSSKDSRSTMYFYGRRIKCRDTGTHLIPSGVFTRLQVKLQTFCGVGSERSYRFGYHWASFVKSRVSVMVRFGRVTARSDQSSTLLPATSMEEDNHPEWIDILLSCPSSQDSTQVQAGTSVEDTIMQQIKKIIFDICQATSRGIPTVVLEEWALRHVALDDAMQLTEIEDCIHANGLASYVSWGDQESTPLVDLLLPEEVQHHVASHVQAIQKVEEEFPSSTLVHIGDDAGDGPQSDEGSSKELGKGDQQSKIMYDLEKINRKLDMVLALVKEIKQDVHKVLQNLQQMEVSIVAKCSTGLLQQLLLHHVLPAYSYLTNSEGKMQRLKFFQGSKATVHFLCESHIEGPHVVEGQKGREVVVERGILVKWAPFLIPSLMVLCCAARFAANVYLPGVAPLFFDPFLKFLNAINITAEDLQSEIIPQAVNALFDQLDVKIQGLHDQKAPFITFGKEQQREGAEALQHVLGSIQDLNMEKDFGLHLCSVQDGQRAVWLCKEHAKAHKQLRQPFPNPFSKIAN